MDAFRRVFNEENQDPYKLVRSYPGQLDIRVTEQKKIKGKLRADTRTDVMVVDVDLVTKLEPHVRRYMKLYGNEDCLRLGLPKPLKDCSDLTRS